MDKATFADRHRWDNWFWAAFLVTGWLAIVVGFWPPIVQRFTGQASYAAPPILIGHVWIFFGWVVLLTVQVLLINRRRADLHRRLGLAGAVLAVLVVATGLGAEIHSQRFWAKVDPENVRFFTFPLYTMVVFAVCSALAIRARRRPDSHKRLILLATCAVMAVPYMRSWGSLINRLTGSGVFNSWAQHYLVLDLVLATIVLFDLATRASVHRVYRFGIPLMLAGQMAATWIWHTDWWPELARRALSIPLT